MIKFFLLLYAFCIFHGANAESASSEAESEAISNITSTSYTETDSTSELIDETESIDETQYDSKSTDSTELVTGGCSDETEENTDNNGGETDSLNCTLPNESSKCVRSCPPLRTCDNRDKRYHCLVDPEAPCKYQCACDDGFYRNSDGFCVTNDLCDKKCGPNEEYKPDKKTCPLETCPSKIAVIRYACNPNEVGQPGCACKPGFLRLRVNSTCIPNEQCPGQNDGKKCADPNEEYKADKKTCPPEICSSIVSRYACDPKEVGKPGCACKSGFLRLNLNSSCIPTKECPELANQPPECTLPNESPKCVKSCPRPRTCLTRNIHYECPNNANETCKYECVCDNGFYRNSDGFCVTYDLCDEKCTGPNEEYKADKKSCPPQTCPSKFSVSHYACNPKEVGQPGCVCKPGFLRLAVNSTCIPKEKCPSQRHQPTNCTLPNESLKCVKSCPQPWTCETRDLRYKCLNNENETCSSQCVCDDDFYRNSDGFCVTYDLCDEKCTGPNEEYKADKKSCPPQICPSEFSVSHYACDPKEVGQPGCVCKPGFLRLGANSTCVPKEKCPGQGHQPTNCTLPNESLKCVKSCPRPWTCATRNLRYKCLNNANETCNSQCVCDDGFYRNSDGFCVTYDLCNKKCTGPNEEYKADKKTCPPETCKSIVSKYACNPKEVGQPGCVCKSGFLRLNLNSSCIPTKECPELANQPPECTLPNESLKCVKSCPRPRTCLTHNIHYKCANNVNETCKYECVCDDGFYRNSDGFCVTYDLCDEKCTGPNEEYKADKKSCPLQICPSNFSVSHYACDPKEVGQPGCVCKPGFLRLGANSTCVPKEKCPGQDHQPTNCTLPNESLICVKSCPRPRTCATRNLRYKCFNNANETCNSQCVCDDGFYRNSDGFCVTYDLCDKKCTGPNEEYKADKKTCPLETCRSIVSRFACDPKEVGQPGCACKPGFLRLDLNSSCIPTKECPEIANQPPDCSLPNESLQCVKSCPRPRTCSTRNLLYRCFDNKNETCKSECVCNDGFYRNSDGFCVTYDLCDKKCPGPNEVYKADKKTCPLEICPSNKFVIRYACNPREKGYPGCACKPGFFRRSPGSTCIPKEECPGQGDQNKTCGINEIWNNCPPESCESCPTNDEEARACLVSTSALAECPPAKCTCRNNYKRALNGTCIPTRDCPPFKCPLANEQFDPCPLCPSDDCERATPNGDCPRIGRIGIPLQCRPSCRCAKDYWRDGDRCIPYKDCPNVKSALNCTLPNESPTCVRSCPPLRTCDNRHKIYSCLVDPNAPCTYQCACDDGFYRNPDGFCVTSELCDKKCSNPNEMYKPDKKKCPPETCQSLLALYKCDSKEKGQPGCACKPGYLRLSLNSTCIPTSDCSKPTNPSNECSLE